MNNCFSEQFGSVLEFPKIVSQKLLQERSSHQRKIQVFVVGQYREIDMNLHVTRVN